jgi:hypothetical protein
MVDSQADHRTRKHLTLSKLHQDLGGGSSGWTRISKPSDYQVNEQDFHADLPGRKSWTQRRQGNAKMLQKSTKQTRRSRCSERFAKGLILNVLVRPARLERATSWFVVVMLMISRLRLMMMEKNRSSTLRLTD